jgi:hypothetical protein
MPTIDQLAALLAEQRRIHGGDAEVVAVIDHGRAGLAVSDGQRPHVARDAALTALVAPVSSRGAEHAAYLAARSIGDYRALRRGRLAHRLIRRAVTRRAASAVWGRW